MVEVQTYSSVWDAITDSPEEASNLKLRAQLMDAIEAYILREGIMQRVAADRLGVPRSRVSELVNGRISKLTIDKLVNMAARAGLADGGVAARAWPPGNRDGRPHVTPRHER